MKFSKTQYIIIIGAFLLVVLLLFANTKIPKKDAMELAQKQTESGNKGIPQLVEELKNSLSQNGKNLFEQHKNQLKSSKNDAEFDVVVHVWDSLQQPLAAAYFYELKARNNHSETNWQEAADRYYVLTAYIEDENRESLYRKAMELYEEVLKVNPENIDAKIDLASCYVNAVNPMQGIGMLKEIEKEHPENVKVQYNLAYFSMQSGQMEKAVERFEKILKLAPDDINIYLSIADVYERMGKIEDAIEYYKKYASLTDNLKAKDEVEKHINKLKN